MSYLKSNVFRGQVSDDDADEGNNDNEATISDQQSKSKLTQSIQSMTQDELLQLYKESISNANVELLTHGASNFERAEGAEKSAANEQPVKSTDDTKHTQEERDKELADREQIKADEELARQIEKLELMGQRSHRTKEVLIRNRHGEETVVHAPEYACLRPDCLACGYNIQKIRKNLAQRHEARVAQDNAGRQTEDHAHGTDATQLPQGNDAAVAAAAALGRTVIFTGGHSSHPGRDVSIQDRLAHELAKQLEQGQRVHESDRTKEVVVQNRHGEKAKVHAPANACLRPDCPECGKNIERMRKKLAIRHEARLALNDYTRETNGHARDTDPAAALGRTVIFSKDHEGQLEVRDAGSVRQSNGRAHDTNPGQLLGDYAADAAAAALGRTVIFTGDHEGLHVRDVGSYDMHDQAHSRDAAHRRRGEARGAAARSAAGADAARGSEARARSSLTEEEEPSPGDK